MAYFVYILKSKKDGKRYIGYTQSLENRLKSHNSGKVFSTKFRRPFEMVYYEEVPSLKEALQREKYLKTSHRDKLLELEQNMVGIAQFG